jgi:hypothetical protein
METRKHSSNEPKSLEAPSRGKIALATVIALIVAAVILFVAVLPAEYGIDPLKTGKALGLMDLAKASEKPQPVASGLETAPASIVPVLEVSKGGGAPTVKGTFISQPAGYKTDSRVIELAPGEGMEIKYHMPKGGGLIYSWTATETISYELHGEPDKNPPNTTIGYYESYDLDDKVGKNQSHGVFVAPSTGVQGWFWENKSGKPVTLKLMSSGFYDWIFQNRNDKETILQPTDPK